MVAPGLDQHRRHPIFVTHQQTDSTDELAAQTARSIGMAMARSVTGQGRR